MAKGNEIEDSATGGRKGAKIQSNKHKHKHKHKHNNKSNSINGTDNDHRDEPQALIVPDFETEDGDEEDEVAQNDNSDEEKEGEQAKSIDIKNRRGDKAENGDERGKSGVTKEEEKQKQKQKQKQKNGKSKKNESDDSHSFPMHRISRIIKSEDADIRITQEAVFLVNKATEMFLELFCKEAYAGAFLDRKNQVWYEHLSINSCPFCKQLVDQQVYGSVWQNFDKEFWSSKVLPPKYFKFGENFNMEFYRKCGRLKSIPPKPF